ncbi:MAG TPA: secretin N-terminal domain-containing protein [Gemmatimonadaceae bacterium]|nr:secretin N-terminal domain-containing protein [Gemmatimonadaceae bacterium]
MKTFARILVLVVVFAAPALAQRGGGPPTRADTGTRRTPTGTVIDFQDQDVAAVLRAIAEAGDLPITMMQMPTARVTLRVQAQMTRETALEMLKSVAEGSGITVTESPSIIRLVGPPPPPRTPTTPPLNPQQALAQAMANRILVLHTVRLKHATATTLAPILMNLLTGTGGIGGRAGFAVPGNVNQPGRGNQAPQQQQQQNQGGRGGRGGDAVLFTPQIITAPGGGVAGGAAGGGRAGQAIQELQATIAQGLGQAFGIQVGGPTTTAAQLAFTDMRIVAEEATNSMIIRGTVEDIQAVLQLVQTVDVRPLQVLIEVTIAQVERSTDLNVGLSTASTRTRRSGTDSSVLGIELPTAATARDFIATLIGSKGSVNYDVAINALQTRGDVRVLSLPIIIAQNNREAIINVGARVPFVQVSQTVPNDPTGRVETVQYQDVGTQLQITPIINTDGYVNMAVAQTADNLTNNVQFDAQIISTRQAQTQVMVRDGQTTVLGGLADNTQTNTTSGIPFLSRIPFIGGWLFGNSQKNKTITELYLFLTPHIVSSDEDIDRLRESIRGTTDMLNGIPLNRINKGGDTINIGIPDSIARRLPPVRRDTGKMEPPDSQSASPLNRSRMFR